MKSVASRKGSALLIVLGMIGIMVISAVAFSAYMRYSRLPSSYLRRTASSRHLAHAAMSEAIDQIDAAIGHNPHPGVGVEKTIYPRKDGDSDYVVRNWWLNHCFIGKHPDYETQTKPELVNASETVSVLNLESLAYIPPSLVNEARYYSRHAATAKWQSFNYEAGRYAFFAIDVSDFLNVNKTFADSGRNSSDRGKFSLAYALESAAHTSYAVKPSTWDDFIDANFVDIDAFRDGTKPSGNKMPFRSLADMGLALYSKAGTLADSFFPFMSYLNGGKSIDSFSDTIAETMRRFSVVADGLSPSCAVKEDLEGDLSNPKQQPFPKMKAGKGAKSTNRDVILGVSANTTGAILGDSLSELDMISLYDYLDENDVPISLAMPTTERVPMICGLQSWLKLSLKPKADVTEVVEGGAKAKANCKVVGDYYLEKTSCKLELLGQSVGSLSAMYMFPFRRDKDAENPGYKGETAIRICFGIGSPGLRTSSDSSYVVQAKDEFNAAGVVGGAVRPKVLSQPLNVSGVDKPESALVYFDAIPIDLGDARTWFQGAELFWVRKKFVVDSIDKNTGDPVFVEDASARTAGVNADFHPVNADGRGDGGFTKDLIMKNGSVTVRPYMTVTSRVTNNKTADTLDLVPASFADDAKYNAVNNDMGLANIGGTSGSQPIIMFSGDKDMEFGVDAFSKGDTIEVTIQPTDAQSVFCPDPRWNFAPENFVKITQPLAKDLYTASGVPQCGLGRDGRDGDIFMFVSNQGYMQSVSELAFLPRTSIDMGGGDERTGNAAFSFDYSDFPTDVTKTKNWDLMWRTYRLYPQGGLAADGIYDIGVFDGGCGQRINPYAASGESIMAAFANTPYSWWAASTNNQDKALEDLDAESFNKSYAFNAMNSDARFAWEDLESVANNISAAMRDDADGDWCIGYNSLDWAGANSDLVGVKFQGSTDDLYGIDRKFLYGFWRDCFAAKQQLFLVFVRAEPMMMGSGSAGKSPPQLGARAMALVWRNPAPGSFPGISGGKRAWPASMSHARYYAHNKSDAAMGDNPTETMRPHQTRILFYRQFE